jgi:hypothetical protein
MLIKLPGKPGPLNTPTSPGSDHSFTKISFLSNDLSLINILFSNLEVKYTTIIDQLKYKIIITIIIPV